MPTMKINNVPNRNNSSRFNCMADSTRSVLNIRHPAILPSKPFTYEKSHRRYDICHNAWLYFRRNVDNMTSRDPPPKKDLQGAAAWIRCKSKDALAWTRRFVPPGLRLVLGLFLIGCGLLGFLPILGFWMIPLGIAVAAMDIRPLWRSLMTHIRRRR